MGVKGLSFFGVEAPLGEFACLEGKYDTCLRRSVSLYCGFYVYHQ